MKRNSIDLRIELLASAREAIEAFGPAIAKHNQNPDESAWHAATVPYRRLKAAVDAYCEGIL